MRRLAAFLPVLLLSACPDPRHLDWSARFELPILETRAVVAEAIILEGGCDHPDDELWHVEYVAGEDPPASMPPVLEPQQYGFVIRARDVACDLYAAGCTEIELPRDDPAPIEVLLSA